MHLLVGEEMDVAWKMAGILGTMVALLGGLVQLQHVKRKGAATAAKTGDNSSNKMQCAKMTQGALDNTVKQTLCFLLRGVCILPTIILSTNYYDEKNRVY